MELEHVKCICIFETENVRVEIPTNYGEIVNYYQLYYKEAPKHLFKKAQFEKRNIKFSYRDR